MRAVGTACLVLLLAATGFAQQQPTTGTVPAAPFWEARAYADWSPAETLVLLTDSPWSRPATFTEPGAEVHTGRMRYHVQWYSAQVIREALVSHQRHRGRTDPMEENQFLNAPHDSYQLYLFAAFFTEQGAFRVVPLEVFAGMTAEQLQESARLVFSAQEYSSRPDRVEFVRRPETQELVGIRFTFARAREAVPPEQARQGQVRFVCPTPRGSVAASFLLDEMTRRGQPDL